jgi:hypothetical protein
MTRGQNEGEKELHLLMHESATAISIFCCFSCNTLAVRWFCSSVDADTAFAWLAAASAAAAFSAASLSSRSFFLAAISSGDRAVAAFTDDDAAPPLAELLAAGAAPATLTP